MGGKGTGWFGCCWIDSGIKGRGEAKVEGSLCV
jgi:hypothetical protein